MTDCKAYPYGRFNATPTNLKLFPNVSNINLPNATKYFGSSLMVYKDSNNNLVPLKGSYYRAVRNGEQSRPGVATSGPIPGLSRPGKIYPSAHNMTKAEKMSYLSKFSGANGLRR